jgi:trigger factor
LKITTERDEQSQVIVRIEVESAELEAAKGKAAKRLANRVAIRGFRPGKAPRALVERYVGQEVMLQEATRDLMPKALEETLTKENIKPIAEPDVKIESQEPLTIIATIPVEPTVTLGDYKEIKFDAPQVDVTEEEVQKTIQQLVDQNSTWEEPEEARPVQEGDQVEIEMQTVRDGEVTGEPFNRTGVVGKGELLEQIEQQVVGMAVGEEKTIEIQRNQPKPAEETPATETEGEADAAEGEAAAVAAAQANTEANAEVEGQEETTPDLPEVETIPLSEEEQEQQNAKPMVYKVKLNSIKVKHEPELNDDFAASVSDLTSMDELTERIRTNLKAQAEANAKRELVDKIVKEAVDRSQVQMPPIMVDAEIHALENSMAERLKQQKLSLDQYLMFTGKDHEAFHEELRPQAENRIKTALVLREIAQAEGITVDQGDLDREVEKMVDEYTLNTPEDARADQVARLRQLFNSKESRDRLSDDIFSRKLGDRLIELATGVKLADPDEGPDLELKSDPNAATEASDEKLDLTQGEVELEASADDTAATTDKTTEKAE